MDWSAYSRLTFHYPADGVLLIKINRPDRLNAMDEVLHTELSRVWLDVDKDDGCRAVVITGEGKAFSAGGDFEMVEATLGSFRVVSRLLKEAADISIAAESGSPSSPRSTGPPSAPASRLPSPPT